MPKKITMLLSLLISLSYVSSGTCAGEVPRLLLCFYVDGMQMELIKSYSPAFSSQGKGLEKLLKQGIVYPKVEWDIIVPNSSTALATVTSGSYPSSHGVGLGVDLHNLLSDSESRGIFTPDRFSASKLLYHTFSDVLREVSEGRCTVYSVAPTAEEAVTVGGKEASAVFWLDDRSQQWCSNSYYPEASTLLYLWKKEKASLLSLDALAQKEIVWRASSQYRSVLLPYYREKESKGFQHTFKGYRKCTLYKQSALVNDAVASLSEALIERIGEGDMRRPAILHIVLSCRVSDGQAIYSPYSPETIDAYCRVDNAIATLITKAEKVLGTSNIAISLVSLPVSDSPFISISGRWTTPSSQEASYNHIQALINFYLSALYGKGNWVAKIEEPFLYFDRSLIERKGFPLFEVRQRTASLMEEMSEVAKAYPLGSSVLYTVDPYREQILHSLPSSSSADLFFISYKTLEKSSHNKKSERSVMSFLARPTFSFILLYHRQLGEGVVCRPVHIASWSATWAYIFRIRPPSQSQGLPLDEVFCTSSH